MSSRIQENHSPPGRLSRNLGRFPAHILIMLVLLPIAASPGFAQKNPDIRVEWSKDFTAITFNFMGQKCEYPADMLKGRFPPPGRPPQFKFDRKWPVVTMVATWTASVKGWPDKYRSEAVDLMLMYACDAQLYEYIFPDIISKSSVSFPPEFLKEAHKPEYNLAENMRGKEVQYTITAKAGFGASDYEIKTKIRIGLSKDGKTVFYHDSPQYISEHLKNREFFFAGHDAGNNINFEVRMLCVCAPRRLMRGEMMRRIEASGKYFVERIYEDLDDAPTVEEIERYLSLVRDKKQPIKALFKK